MTNKLRRVLLQTIRGCGDLPIVGDHPGTIMLAALVLLGGASTMQNGGRLIEFVLWVMFMTLCTLPIYLYGAYYRAEDSDYFVQQELIKNQPDQADT